MVTLILPGYSPKNKEWLEDTANKIRSESEIRPIYWGHWTDPNIQFKASEKANLLDGISGKRVIDIVAKSIGTLAASYLIEKSPQKIRKIIFCGIPLNDLDENDKEVIKRTLRNIDPVNFICLQNIDDPHGSFESVQNFLSSIGNDLKIVSQPRSDHEYFYDNDFNEFLLG